MLIFWPGKGVNTQNDTCLHAKHQSFEAHLDDTQWFAAYLEFSIILGAHK